MGRIELEPHPFVLAGMDPGDQLRDIAIVLRLHERFVEAVEMSVLADDRCVDMGETPRRSGYSTFSSTTILARFS